jgi:hypothetical protein
MGILEEKKKKEQTEVLKFLALLFFSSVFSFLQLILCTNKIG